MTIEVASALEELRADWATPAEPLPKALRSGLLCFLAASSASDLLGAASLHEALSAALVTAALAVTVLWPVPGACLMVALMVSSTEIGSADHLVIPVVFVAAVVAATNPLSRALVLLLFATAWGLWMISQHLFIAEGVLWTLIPLLVVATWVAAFTRALRRRHRTDRVAIDILTGEVEEARSAERQRLAGELHDLVAHDLTVLVMLSSLGATGATKNSPEKTFSQIEQRGRSALADLRRLFGVLERSASPVAATADSGQATTREDLAQCLDQMQSTLTALGFVVHARREGNLDRVPLSLQHALRRSIQESVTNVGKYARPHSEVELALLVSDDEVTLRVRNETATRTPGSERPTPHPAGRSGVGLVHHREQAEAFGGRFMVLQEQHHWSVELALPLSPPEGQIHTQAHAYHA